MEDCFANNVLTPDIAVCCPTDAPRLTVATLSPSSPVSEGRIVVFTCSSDANPPVSLYTWYRATTSAYAQHVRENLLYFYFIQVLFIDLFVQLCSSDTFVSPSNEGRSLFYNMQ